MRRRKVAVITRTKNRNILLRRAIHSVLEQTFQDWMMIIVNDGGDREAVEELISEYRDVFGERCLVIHNGTSVGMEAASNIGIKSSDSEYLVIHDDDDSWHPSFLEKCIRELDAPPHPRVAGVIAHSMRVLERIENGRIILEQEEPFNTWLQSVTIYRMAAGNPFPPVSFVYQRKVLDEIGYYREDLPVLGDWEFNLRFVRKYDIHLIPEILAYYHHRLDMKYGEFSNSVIGGHSRHIFYDTLIRNELLRNDLDRNTIGMGYLVNISKSFEIIHSQISPIEGLLNRLKKINWLRKLVKNVLWKSAKRGT